MTTFVSKTGFKPVKHISGSPFNGQGNIYVNSGATSVVPGDVVKLAADGSTNGTPNVTIINGATDVPVGVVIGVINAKLDPVSGTLTTGAINLETPQVGAQNAYVLVADDPDLIFETEIATYATTGINANHEFVTTTYNTTTGASNMKIVFNGGEQADPVKLIGAVNRPDFSSTAGSAGYYMPVASDTNVKVYVLFNVHAYKGSAGVAGV